MHEQVNGQTVADPANGVLSATREERTTDTRDSVDQLSQGLHEGNKAKHERLHMTEFHSCDRLKKAKYSDRKLPGVDRGGGSWRGQTAKGQEGTSQDDENVLYLD